ncbi:uncharacterized protein LOC124775427 [Schistocerca piceifrons]|uniref:uncharacterized protein LOC124775427 n=1 Tax=Schistocerca piceifrons TaxID=274613 RepID=UPI001F5F6DE9|nr:uncharacterized protein LOC124775427 [Schistocerca piceifrons]
MGFSRYRDILICLRFDDKLTREERKTASGSKAEPVRAEFEMFVDACISSYVPGSYDTVDEHMCAFRERCRFKVYIPSKPGKYGIKVWAAVDCETNYVINAQVYTGKSTEGREINQGKRVLQDLVDHLKGSSRNITSDNFFTSFDFGQELLANELTLVGTLRANRKEIPK